VHSARVVNANGIRGDRQQEGDALVADYIGKSLGIRTADCVPILLLDSKNRALAAVHAGWRGTAAGIVSQTIGALREDFNSEPRDLYVAIGPCIRSCCYEVGEEVARNFYELFPEWTSEDKVKRNLDLPEANTRLMERAGLRREQVFDSCLCTKCQPEQFFSYRREPGNPGRMVSAIARLG
jgi:YfiH family protein